MTLKSTVKPTKFEILITQDAQADLEQIHDFLVTHQSLKHANDILDDLSQSIKTLTTVPERCSHPRELLALGILEFRQLIHHRFRIIYRIIDRQVVIQLIADGRQDMQSLLSRRVMSLHSNHFH
jgi:toxin ParE1/3/4